MTRTTKNGIATCVAGLLAVSACTGEPPDETALSAEAGPLVELRLASEDPGPGLESFPWQGADLWVEPEPVVSNADFQRLSAEARPGELILQIELGDGGADRLGTTTAGSVGRRLAVLIDGRVVSASVIRDRIGWRMGAWIPLDDGGLAQDDADRLARAINDAWTR